MLGVVGEQPLSELEQLEDSWVGDPVEDAPLLALGLDEAAPAQAGEVVGDLRLRYAEPLDELADGQLAFVAQQLEDADPGGVAEAAEVLGDEVALGRSAR